MIGLLKIEPKSNATPGQGGGTGRHMAFDRYDQKAKIASLLADVPQFKEWIEDVVA